MTIYSMTGYGSATREVAGWRAEVDCRSVNRKHLDIRISLPGQWSELEKQVRDLVQQRVHRGRFEVGLDLSPVDEGDSNPLALVDRKRFKALYNELEELSEEVDLGSVKLQDILQFRDELEAETLEHFESPDALLPVFEEALDGLVETRREEGKALNSKMLAFVADLEENLESLEQLWPAEIEKYRTELRERLEETLEAYHVEDVDEESVRQELAYYVEKADIAEELDRIESHLDTLRTSLEGDQRVEGKELDFYLQELIRETNTMSSKSKTPDATDIIIDMKSTVEKLREQTANIE